MNKYGDPKMSIEEIDRRIEALRAEAKEVKNDPKRIKDINFNINVLETIKAVKLDAATKIAEKEKAKAVKTEEQPQAEPKAETQEEESIPNLSKNGFSIPEITSEEERLNLLLETLPDKNKKMVESMRKAGKSEEFISKYIYTIAKTSGATAAGNKLLDDFLMEDVLNNPQDYSEAVIVNAMRRKIDGTSPINTGRAEQTTKEILKTTKEDIQNEEPFNISWTNENKLINYGTTSATKGPYLEFQGKYRTGQAGFLRLAYETALELGLLDGPGGGQQAAQEANPIDKTEYEIHLEGNYGSLGWQVYDKMSVPGIKIGDRRSDSAEPVSFKTLESDNNKVFIITDRTVRDHVGRPGATSVAMVFDKNSPRTIEEVKEILVTLNSEIQSTRSSDRFDNSAKSKIERLNLKEIATPDVNMETAQEESKSVEEIIIKEEISPQEEERLKNELEADMNKDIVSEQAEVSQIPIGEMEGYLQQLQEEEEALLKRLKKKMTIVKTLLNGM